MYTCNSKQRQPDPGRPISASFAGLMEPPSPSPLRPRSQTSSFLTFLRYYLVPGRDFGIYYRDSSPGATGVVHH